MLWSSQKWTQLASRRTAAHWVVRLPSGWRTIDRTKCVMQPADATASQFCCCYCIVCPPDASGVPFEPADRWRHCGEHFHQHCGHGEPPFPGTQALQMVPHDAFRVSKAGTGVEATSAADIGAHAVAGVAVASPLTVDLVLRALRRGIVTALYLPHTCRSFTTCSMRVAMVCSAWCFVSF